MSVILGGGTLVTTSLFPSGGIVSISFGITPSVTRLWQLGSFSPYDTLTQNQRNISINAYGQNLVGVGGSQVQVLTPSTSCVDTGSIDITVAPGQCSQSVSPFTDTLFATGYSYSKSDRRGTGQESWTLVSKPIVVDYQGQIKMLRGIATGQHMTGTGSMTTVQMGIVVDEAASKDSLGSFIEGESGNVSAGPLSLGQYDITREVVYSSCGGSVAKADGLVASASVQIPVSPVFI